MSRRKHCHPCPNARRVTFGGWSGSFFPLLVACSVDCFVAFYGRHNCGVHEQIWSSNAERAFTTGDLSRDLLAVLDAEKVAQATIVGISLGAWCATELAIDHPDRVNGLVLLGATPFSARPAVAQKLAREWWDKVKTKGERATLLDAVAAGTREGAAKARLLLERFPTV